MSYPNAMVTCHRLMPFIAAASCATLVGGCGGSGAMSAPSMHAAAAFSISVTVSGLSGAGLVLQDKGGDDLSIETNGVATFSTPIDSGTTYAVTVGTQPTHPAQTCSVSNGSGVVSTAAISGIAVTCATNLATVTTLYSFASGGFGASPIGSLVQGPDGSLYGTTPGIVFRITTAGEETTLYSFPPASSVGYVGDTSAGLTLANDGNFYGTTQGQGLGSDVSGAVYRISPSGTESSVYIWTGIDSGDLPLDGGVIQASNGLFYGTAYGSSVFTLDKNGGESEFPLSGYGCDGVSSSLVQAHDGNLYGVTACAGPGAQVFKVAVNSIPNTATVIGTVPGTSFRVGSLFSLIDGGDGNLYGTTSGDGSPSATCPQGCGTVFKVASSGVITVLYSFGASPVDGQNPSGALVLASDGNFYGTTSAGGSANANCKVANGCGTLYRITPGGTETLLYSFGTSPSDGIRPSGALLQTSDGSLYGTTIAGGPADSGTVFKVQLSAN
jgi:uncharacterized repeat protein (TIGR03803 family)